MLWVIKYNMGWSCLACTFVNGRDNSTSCEVCGTTRLENAPSSTSTEPPSDGSRAKDRKKSQQMTLFGTKLSSVDDGAKMSATTKKKKTSKDGTIKENGGRAISSTSASRKRKEPSTAAASIASPTPRFQQHFYVRKNLSYEMLWKDAQHVLKSNFGLHSLRNLQPSAVKCALEKQSQIVVMATGGGKSLCYQLPATVLGGITFVISPLIALMTDQVQSLNQKGIPAALISSTVQTATQNRSILEQLVGRNLANKNDTAKKSSNSRQTKLTDDNNNANGKNLTLLYITPESIKTEQFRSVLSELYKQDRIAMFAIDEAHCLSR